MKMAEAIFHESTINALKYYASHGYNHFDDSAKIIRDWFNTLNVKSIDYGVRKRDERRNAVQRESVSTDLSHITKFTEWLESWKREYQSKGGHQYLKFSPFFDSLHLTECTYCTTFQTKRRSTLTSF